MQLKSKIFLSFFCASVLGASAQNPVFDWGGRFGGVGEDVIRDVHVDAAGNVYTTGYFTDDADFNIGSGINTLVSEGFFDVFVQKTDASGNLVWAKNFGSSQFDYGTTVTSDAQGNVYVSGLFEETADFDPGPGVTELTSLGQDIFIVKFDVNGNFVWARRVGGTGYDESQGIGVDAQGNVYVGGYFNDTVDFDPGAGTSEATGLGMNDNFVLKLNSAGNFVWVKTFGNAGFEGILSLKVNAAGDQYITGFFEGTVDFDPGAGEHMDFSALDAGAFVLKLDAGGNFQFVSVFRGAGSASGYDVDFDATGNIYVTGPFRTSVDFDPGAGETILTTNGLDNAYVVKLGPTGSLVWAKAMTSGEALYSYAVSVDGTGNVWTAGYFENTTDFNPAPGTAFELTPGATAAMGAYAGKLDASGNFLGAWSFGGVNFADYHGLGTDANGNVYLAAAFDSTVDIDPSPTVSKPVSSMQFRDNYIIKMKPSYASVAEEPAATDISIFPNPAGNVVTIRVGDELLGSGYRVIDPSGREVHSGVIVQSQTGIDVSTFGAGVYLIRVSENRVFKLIVN